MKRSNMLITAAVAALVLLASFGQAQAAVRVVPTQHATIQDAEDNASDGDTILILPGEYRESVTIDVPNLRVRGLTCAARSAIVDGGMGGTIFDVDADGVMIACLTTRHGATGIDVTGSDLRVDRVSILKPQSYGIYIASGDNFDIRQTEIQGSSNTGVYVLSGAGGNVSDTSVRGAYSDCFYFGDSDNLQFTDNKAQLCYGYSIDASGDGMSIEDNVFVSNDEGIYVSGNDNTVDDNVVNGSCYDDDGIYVSGTDNSIQNNNVTGCYYDGISAYGDRNQIQDNVVSTSSDDYCYDIGGDDVSLIGNECTGASYYGIYFSGNNGDIRQNTVESALYDPLYVYGDDNQIVGNTVRGSYYGLYVQGDRPLVDNNTVTETQWEGFYTYGANPTVTDNTCSMGGYEVFYVSCFTDCTSALVSGNHGSNVGGYDGYSGFYIEDGGGKFATGVAGVGPVGGMTISDNTSVDNHGHGFDFYTFNATISGNAAMRNGGYDGYRSGFYIGGAANTLTDNRAIGNTGPGFEIASNDNALTMNEATSNLLEGFRIASGRFGNTLTQNVAQDNQAEGIDNQGTSTDLVSNTSTGNRTDCTSDGTVNSDTGNICSDASDFDMSSEIGESPK